jgi:hypothetical protein
MKFLLALLGLGLFGGSIYALVWLYPQFDVLELTRFGTYLGLSFVASSFGLYAFLLSLRPKQTLPVAAATPNDSMADGPAIDLDATRVIPLDQLKPETLPTESVPSEESTPETHMDNPASDVVADALALDEAASLESQAEHPEALDLKPNVETSDQTLPLLPPDLTNIADQTAEPSDVESTSDVDDAELTRVMVDLIPSTLATPNDDESPDALDTLNLESANYRIMDIDSWRHQRWLKRAQEGDELKLNVRQKSGLSLALLEFNGHEIGYLPKMDYLKVVDRLERLHSIDLVELVREGSKVVHAGVRFRFKSGA